MTIHHDKLLYGKLESLQSEFSEEQILAMAGALKESETPKNADDRKQKTPRKPANTKKNEKNK